jgi:hypothetical protein
MGAGRKEVDRQISRSISQSPSAMGMARTRGLLRGHNAVVACWRAAPVGSASMTPGRQNPEELGLMVRDWQSVAAWATGKAKQ